MNDEPVNQSDDALNQPFDAPEPAPVEEAPQTPQEPAAPDLSQIPNEQLMAQMYARGLVPPVQQVPQAPAAQVDPYEAIADLMFTDPAKYHREVVRITQEAARRDMESMIAPMQRQFAEQTVTQGLPPEAQGYAADIIRRNNLRPDQMNDEVVDLIRYAALGKAAQKNGGTVPVPRTEPINAAPQVAAPSYNDPDLAGIANILGRYNVTLTKGDLQAAEQAARRG